MRKSSIAVIGAGIAGLTAAYELNAKGFDVTVFEKEPEVGGRMATRTKDDLPFDIGAQFLATKNSYPFTYQCCQEMGLETLWEPQSPHCHHLFRNGKIYNTAYNSPLEFIRFSYLSATARLRLVLLCFYLKFESKKWNFFDFASTKKSLNRKNTYDFIARWGGEEVAEYVMDPLVAAYQFHSTKELSLSAFFGVANFTLGGNPTPKIHHVIGEMITIPKALSEKLCIQRSTPVKELKKTHKGIEVSTENGTSFFDAAIIATPTPAALRFYTTPTVVQKELLQLVQYASCINVAFRVPVDPIKDLAVVMIPMRENKFIASYVHQAPKGIDSVKNGKSLVNVLLNDEGAKELMNRSDNEIFEAIKKEFLSTCPPLADLGDEVENYDIQRWPQAMPKFSPETVTQIDHFWENGQGENLIFFCGDYLNSPWIEGGIRCGKRVAAMVQESVK